MVLELWGNDFVLGVAIISYLWIYRWQQRNNLGPKSWPVLGCLLEFRSNFHRNHDWMTDYIKKSPTATISSSILGVRFVWIGRPDNVEFVLKTSFANFPKGPLMYERMSTFLGNGIVMADGEVWKQNRKIASFEFSSRKLRDFSTNQYRLHGLRHTHAGRSRRCQ